jgi:hypothetical protein
MTTFTQSQTIPGEYFLGDFPGTLQYKMNPDNILEAVKSLDTTRGDLYCGYEYVDLSNDECEELIQAVIPDTATGNANTWTPLLLMRKKTGNEIWLKGALQNNDTNEIALMTSTNSYDALIQTGSRGIHSHHPDWMIGHYRMVAPRTFWMTLGKLLKPSYDEFAMF